MPTILLTRPEHQTEPLKSELEALGLDVLLQPTIAIKPPDSWIEVDDAIRRLMTDKENHSFDWLVFSSGNGVDFFFDRIRSLQEQEASFDPEETTFGLLPNQLSFLQPVRIAVVGSGTDESVQRRIGRRADVLPHLFAAEGVLENLLPEAKAGKRFLLLRASRGRDVLMRSLQNAGGEVAEVVVYQSVDMDHPAPENLEAMRQEKIDWVTVTSSAIARSLVRMFGETLRKTNLISISPITSDTLREMGFPPQLEAKTASMEGIVEALKSELKRKSRL